MNKILITIRLVFLITGIFLICVLNSDIVKENGQTGRTSYSYKDTVYGLFQMPDYQNLPEVDPKFADDDLVIEIENGRIRGTPIITSHNYTIFGFLQIPYAAPPVGKWRFKEPQAPNNWEGILNATKITKICMECRPNQVHKAEETEDCLYVNVYLPKLPSKERKGYAVIAYIYGGAFRFGSTMEYNPQLFAEFGVIFVNFNYRTGPFGFLTTEDGVIPGNLALKDQNFALKWIQRNINRFGGDPKKVTIMGHSSGGICVAHHVASKKSAGLFRSALIQSAYGIGHMTAMANAREVAYKVGKALSPDFTDTNSTTDLYEILMKVPAKKLASVDVQNDGKSINSFIFDLDYLPVLERNDSENAFLEGSLYGNYDQGNFNKIPVLMGTTSEEFLGMEKIAVTREQVGKKIFKNPKILISKYANIKEERKLDYFDELQHIYTNRTLEEDDNAFISFMSDNIFSFPILKQAEIISKFSYVYVYKFCYRGEVNMITNVWGNNVEGLGKVGHGDDASYILYLYTKADVNDDILLKKDTVLTRYRLLKLFTNFVKYTNPTPTNDDPLLQFIEWPKFSRESLEYLNIDGNLSLRSNPRNYSKWVSIFEKYYEQPINEL